MPSRRTTRIAAALALAVSLAACGGGDEAEPEAAASTGQEVEIRLVAFTPEELEIDAGSTVTWTNADPGTHTVTSGEVEEGTSGVTPSPDGTFDSGDLAGDDTFEHSFDEPGTYPYYCALHPATMRGVITVR